MARYIWKSGKKSNFKIRRKKATAAEATAAATMAAQNENDTERKS